ncbi:hypothetical protein, partial [Vibrio cincinnatiensis]|uniref:hypothetical protein n=1 Tax=Vibrio cincinnatiensis TaxID=675 RepID=UPI001EDE5FDE
LYSALSSIKGRSFIASSLVNRIAMNYSLSGLKLVVIRFIYEYKKVISQHGQSFAFLIKTSIIAAQNNLMVISI